RGADRHALPHRNHFRPHLRGRPLQALGTFGACHPAARRALAAGRFRIRGAVKLFDRHAGAEPALDLIQGQHPLEITPWIGDNLAYTCLPADETARCTSASPATWSVASGNTATKSSQASPHAIASTIWSGTSCTKPWSRRSCVRSNSRNGNAPGNFG